MTSSIQFTALLLLSSSVLSANGGYLITTPRVWTSGGISQICVTLDTPASPNDIVSIGVGLIPTRYEQKVDNIGIKDILRADFPVTTTDGKNIHCENIEVPSLDTTRQVQFSLYGTLNGEDFVHAVNGSIRGEKEAGKTYVQTDKYLNKPGQTVNFRILTIHGSNMELSTEPYSVVYVESPSGTRIGQWRNVNNSQGLVHLQFELAEEPDYGVYKIKVESSNTNLASTTFKVDEYVLPRYEVTLKLPNYITKVDDKFNITVCAKYTYGEDVVGRVNITVDNNQWGSCDHSLNFEVPISGCQDVEFSGRQLYFQTPSCYLYRISVNAYVIEDGTLVTIHADRANAVIHDRLLTFKSLNTPSHVKSGLPYVSEIEVGYPDDTPASSQPFEVCWNLPKKGDCKNVTSTSTGEIKFILPTFTPFNIRSLLHGNVKNNFSDTDFLLHTSTFDQYSIQSYFSPTNSSLLIKAVPEQSCLPDGTTTIDLEVMFTANNQPSANVFIQIISRGQVQFSTSTTVPLSQSSFNIDNDLLVAPIKVPENKNMTTGSFRVPIKLTSTASPSAKVLLWYIREDGEVVADSTVIKIEECLNYKVDMSWSEGKVGPGEESILNLQAEPSALCSIGVVDKSVELLSKNKKQITINSLFSVANSHEVNQWQHNQINDNAYCSKIWEKEKNATLIDKVKNPPSSAPVPFSVSSSSDTIERSKRTSIIRPPTGKPYFTTENKDAFILLQDFGLFTFTNLQLENRPCIEGFYHEFEEAPLAFSSGGGSGGGFQSKTQTGKKEARTYFPETWLWDLEVIGPDGKWEKPFTLPDTITEWVGETVCVHKTEGVGLSSKTSVTTFTPFFIDLTLPAIVTRGEIIPVKISVFNYEKIKLPVKMTLSPSSEYDILSGNSSEVQTEAIVLSSCVSPGDKEVFTVRLRLTALGDVNITVSAEVDESQSINCPNVNNVSKRDAIVKPLKVEAEGFPRERTWSKYICSRDEEKEELWNIDIPPVTVQGSDRAFVNVAGDAMATTLANLERLIRMPFGCGEQNMIKFAPNVFILNYLEHSNQTTKEIVYRLKYYIRNGYQQQQRFKWPNGAYSVFGPSDYSGSTWLTAFVVKSFAQARNYTLIDEVSLQKSIDWLVDDKQSPDGCYIPTGKVLHKGMKGGVHLGTSDFLHTAYLLISLLESKLNVSENSTSAALECIKSDDTQNYYGQSLKAYALALAGDPEASVILDKMVEDAETLPNSMHWPLDSLGDSSDAVEVETAAYVVLAMMRVDHVKYKDAAWKIIRWMTTKRSALGGFVSTQDTIVALQALALFDMKQPKPPLDLSVGLSASNVKTSVKVNHLNKLLQQTTILPELPTDLSLNLEGNGCALVQAVLRYNAPDPDPSKAFVLKVETDTALDVSCKTKIMKVCAAYRTILDPESNMAIIEVNLISGYVPIKEDLKKVARNKFKRYEVDGRKVTFYADQITEDWLCAKFRVVREIDVEEAQNGIAKVYDYYEPDQQVSVDYSLDSSDDCNYEQQLPTNEGLYTTYSCWRRRWQRPSVNVNPESDDVGKTDTSLTTWCLPKGTFKSTQLTV